MHQADFFWFRSRESSLLRPRPACYPQRLQMQDASAALSQGKSSSIRARAEKAYNDFLGKSLAPSAKGAYKLTKAHFQSSGPERAVMVAKLHGDYPMDGVVFYQTGIRARVGSAGANKSYDAPLGLVVTEDRTSLVMMRHLQNGLTKGSEPNMVATDELRDSWVVEHAHSAMLAPVRSGAAAGETTKVIGILRQVDQDRGEAEAERLWQTRHRGKPSAIIHIKGAAGAMAAMLLCEAPRGALHEHILPLPPRADSPKNVTVEDLVTVEDRSPVRGQLHPDTLSAPAMARG